jgi:hypothetical protein
VVRIHLHSRPGIIVREPCIFRFNTDEIGVAILHALPDTFPGVVGPPGSNDKVRTIPTKAKLSERPREVGAPVDEGVKAGHVAIPWPGGVVANHTEDTANVDTAPVFPAINQGDFQTGSL